MMTPFRSERACAPQQRYLSPPQAVAGAAAAQPQVVQPRAAQAPLHTLMRHFDEVARQQTELLPLPQSADDGLVVLRGPTAEHMYLLTKPVYENAPSKERRANIRLALDVRGQIRAVRQFLPVGQQLQLGNVAESLALMVKARSVLQTFDLFALPAGIFVVQTYCAAGDLRSLLPESPKDWGFRRALSRQVLCDVAEALVALGDAGIVHSDLHQGHLLLRDGRFVLTGFDFALPIKSLALSHAGASYFPAPETDRYPLRARGSAIDIWNLGRTVQELWPLGQGENPPLQDATEPAYWDDLEYQHALFTSYDLLHPNVHADGPQPYMYGKGDLEILRFSRWRSYYAASRRFDAALAKLVNAQMLHPDAARRPEATFVLEVAKSMVQAQPSGEQQALQQWLRQPDSAQSNKNLRAQATLQRHAKLWYEWAGLSSHD